MPGAVDLTWPADLPAFQAEGYVRRPRPLAVRFEPEQGPAIQRRVTRGRPEELRLTLRLTAAQLDRFWAFWEEAGGGGAPFRMQDPVRGDAGVFLFHALETPEESVQPPHHVVTLTLTRRS